eukprot:3311144-Pleurochrysis_carterae.AAC.1
MSVLTRPLAAWTPRPSVSPERLAVFARCPQHCTNKQRPCEPREEMKRGRPRTVRPAEAKGTVDAS